MRAAYQRAITTVSHAIKPLANDNEWDLESQSSNQLENPFCSTISLVRLRAKSSSTSQFIYQQVPSVFTTTSECLGKIMDMFLFNVVCTD
jgi:hypothetical protein